MTTEEAKELSLNRGYKGFRVVWEQVTDKPLQCGDMWASRDPNTPGRQGGNDYNLQMQAVHTDAYGIAPCENNPHVNLGNGAYWRPIGLKKTA